MNEQIKRKFIQFKMIEEQIQEISKQMDKVERQQRELVNTNTALEGLKDLDKDEILIPLAAGIYAKGTIDAKQPLLVNVGGGSTVARTIDETKLLVKEQVDQLAEYEQQLTQKMMQLSSMADTINDELAELQKKEA